MEHAGKLIHTQHGKGCSSVYVPQSWHEVWNPISIPGVNQDGFQYDSFYLQGPVPFRRACFHLASKEPRSPGRILRLPGSWLWHRPWSTPAFTAEEAWGRSTSPPLQCIRVDLLPGTARASSGFLKIHLFWVALRHFDIDIYVNVFQIRHKSTPRLW